MAFAAYRAPLDFVRSDPASRAMDQIAAQRSVSISITPQGGTSQPQQIMLVRPPVALVHGLWSPPSARDFLSPLVDANSMTYDSRFSVTRLNYAATNAQGFTPNATLVLQQLDDFINIFKTGSFGFSVAAVQADIVAHSMGGDIIRTFATLPRFLRLDNYASGDVHKLISIDTPYTGSPFASNLLASNGFCKAKFKDFGRNTAGGAISDLAGGSPILKTTLAQPTVGISAHAIAGGASLPQTQAAEINASFLGLNIACPSLLSNGHFQGVFGGPSDLIVSQSSQSGTGVTVTGGSLPLPTDVVPGIIHAADPQIFPLGPDALSRGVDIANKAIVFSDSGNGQRVIDLLNSSVLSNAFLLVRP